MTRSIRSDASSGRLAVIVLAAGAGTRMKSALPKPLHPVAGLPMIGHVLRATRAVEPVQLVLVVAPNAEQAFAEIASSNGATIAVQPQPLGTADAVRSALSDVGEVEHLLILFADHPLLTAGTVESLVSRARATKALVTILTGAIDNGTSYARVERNDSGRVSRIVERKDDDVESRPGPIEFNSGMMAVDAEWASGALERIEASPATGELYLPELVRLAVLEAGTDRTWPVESVAGPLEELLGVNDRIELARADAIVRERVCRRHMASGVSMIMPESIAIDVDVEIGQDTTIHPFSVIESGTRIGAKCRIGPHAVIRGSAIGDGVAVVSSTIVDSVLDRESDAGPYAHLRASARIGAGAHIGSYAEIKCSSIGEQTRIGHFSYVGDAKIGADTNIGAGTVTCNFDGVAKHVTVIGSRVFVGSDTMLVAPVELGDGARTGAGSVVTKNVPADTTVVGVPARPITSKRRLKLGAASGGNE